MDSGAPAGSLGTPSPATAGGVARTCPPTQASEPPPQVFPLLPLARGLPAHLRGPPAPVCVARGPWPVAGPVSAWHTPPRPGPGGYFHSTMLMQAFLSGFSRVKQNRARGGLGRISGAGFLGCFFLRPSSWGEGGSMLPAALVPAAARPAASPPCVPCALALGSGLGVCRAQAACWASGGGARITVGVKLAPQARQLSFLRAGQ